MRLTYHLHDKLFDEIRRKQLVDMKIKEQISKQIVLLKKKTNNKGTN